MPIPGHLGLLCGISKFKMSSFAFRWRKRHFNRGISNEGYKCMTCISVFPKGPPIKEDKWRVYPVTFYLKVQTIEAHRNKSRRNTHTHTQPMYRAVMTLPWQPLCICTKAPTRCFFMTLSLLGWVVPSAAPNHWHSTCPMAQGLHFSLCTSFIHIPNANSTLNLHLNPITTLNWTSCHVRVAHAFQHIDCVYVWRALEPNLTRCTQ